MYRIEFTASARRDLTRIPDKVRPAIFEMIDGPLAENPQRVGKPLELQLAGLHVARRGEYRIVYQVDEAEALVIIQRVAHRRDIYG